MSKATSPILEDLKARGLVTQTTPGLEDHLTQPRTLYCGFDPSADSLHIGSLVPLLTLRRFQLAGHTPIVVVGGSTGMIGDPSFKADERKLNTEDTVREWSEKLKRQTSAFVSFKGKNAAIIANNYDWTKGVSVLSFLRDTGKHFTVNNLIAKDAIKARLEREGSGISFTEFTYPLLQAFDFQQLKILHHCTVQIGGSDQWGNMTAGTELIRKTGGGEAHVMTLPLVKKADGTKFGKTESGTIWLSAEKTSPDEFRKFWLNTADADIENFLHYFSFMSLEEIAETLKTHRRDPGKRFAQKALAAELTKLIHGEDTFEQAEASSSLLFEKDVSELTEPDLDNLAHTYSNVVRIQRDGQIDGLNASEIIETFIEKGFMRVEHVGEPRTFFLNMESKLDIASTLVLVGLAKSNREAREFVAGGSIVVNGEKITQTFHKLEKANAKFGKYHLIKRGKKNFALLILE